MSDVYVYVIGREEGPVKVGISANPDKRTTMLQTGCPFRLQLLHKVKAETRAEALQHEAHFRAVYDDVRLYGEWFNLTADLAIEGVDTGFEIDAHFKQRGIDGTHSFD